MCQGVRKMIVLFVNFVVERGDMKELKFRAATSIISRQGVQMDFLAEVCWLAVF